MPRRRHLSVRKIFLLRAVLPLTIKIIDETLH